jgi:hypothetical protein
MLSDISPPYVEATIPKPSDPANIADKLAAACAILFVAILALSAYWDPSIRVLHVFEAVPYLLAALLILRRRKYGYVLGIASGAFWLWSAGFLTRFVRNGFERLATLLQTGHVDRWDIFIAVPAAIGTGGLVLFSVLGYLRSEKKSRSDVVLLLATTAVVAGFFVGIFYVFAPRYLAMFKPVLRRLGISG